MSPTLLWLIVIGMGLITFSIRLSFIQLLHRVTILPLLRRGLKYVPPAVLSAIIFPEVLRPGGTLGVSWGNPRLLAALVAVLVAWRTRNVLWTIAAGMVVLWLLL
ncbi:MAG: AzlD domain-containing protein [Anaerolineales bacterium]|nr:AzlD domain-containing protein [Anaerolineales bacterium]MCB8953098.1 AzlD domain-containing protein [Ardenticatenales bacterium]